MSRSRTTRRVAAALSLAPLVLVAGCGGSGSSDEPTGEASASAAEPSVEPSVEPGASADGACGGGAFETEDLELPGDLAMTVPADWETESGDGINTRLYPPDFDLGDGYVFQEIWRAGLDQAVSERLRATARAAEETSSQSLELEGFKDARMVTFVYDDGTFAVEVLALTENRLVQANMTRKVPEEQPAAESCLSSLAHTG